MSSIIIRAETAQEIPIATAILQAAYGRDDEAKLVHAARDSSEHFHPALSIVAADDNQIVGYALYCRTHVGGQASALLTTIGVVPERQRQGVGERLIRHGLDRCRGLGIELIFVIGHPEYFSRLGFRPIEAHGIQPTAPIKGIQVIDLSGSLLGKVAGSLQIPSFMLQPAS
ncbi:MAG: N-acetyltransferase [Elusimicrobiota bacterium]